MFCSLLSLSIFFCPSILLSFHECLWVFVFPVSFIFFFMSLLLCISLFLSSFPGVHSLSPLRLSFLSSVLYTFLMLCLYPFFFTSSSFLYSFIVSSLSWPRHSFFFCILPLFLASFLLPVLPFFSMFGPFGLCILLWFSCHSFLLMSYTPSIFSILPCILQSFHPSVLAPFSLRLFFLLVLMFFLFFLLIHPANYKKSAISS